jgi:hypothetical protein
MANSFSLSNQFKSDMLGILNGRTIKAALYFAASTTNATNTIYTTTGEATGTNYVAGGATVTNGNSASTVNTTVTGDVQFWTPSASIVFPASMSVAAFDCVMLYDSTTPFHSFGTWSLGGSQTIVSGTVTLTMPTNNNATALIRLS